MNGIRRLTAAHWCAIALMLSSVATMWSSMHSWREAVTPAAGASYLQAGAALILAINSHKKPRGAGVRPGRFINTGQENNS